MNDQLVKWHLRYCGLILVHPFLSRLFKILNFVDVNDQFKNEDFQHRAVQLVYFIASGKIDFNDETDLAMSKILCGMTFQEPFPNDIKLNNEEMTAAQDMLEAVIEHWETLKNTSIDGLRNTFLQRDGLLEEKDNAFQLTIESSGVDVLLDFIPWNIGMVKLPWINNLIFTSWR